jgi:hypothetical protein
MKVSCIAISSGVNPTKLRFLRFSNFLLLSLAISKYRQYFLMLQTLKLNNEKKEKKNSFYEKKSLVGLTPGLLMIFEVMLYLSSLPFLPLLSLIASQDQVAKIFVHFQTTSASKFLLATSTIAATLILGSRHEQFCD